MSEEKTQLTRDGTMDVTTKDGGQQIFPRTVPNFVFQNQDSDTPALPSQDGGQQILPRTVPSFVFQNQGTDTATPPSQNTDTRTPQFPSMQKAEPAVNGTSDAHKSVVLTTNDSHSPEPGMQNSSSCDISGHDSEQPELMPAGDEGKVPAADESSQSELVTVEDDGMQSEVTPARDEGGQSDVTPVNMEDVQDTAEELPSHTNSRRSPPLVEPTSETPDEDVARVAEFSTVAPVEEIESTQEVSDNVSDTPITETKSPEEGVAFLAANNFPVDDSVKETKEDATPKVPRDNTMVNTAKEGVAFLAANNFSKNDAPQESEEDTVPKVARDNTMVNTAKEGEKLLEEQGKPDEDALTRGQQKKIEELTEEADEPDEAPPAKKPRKQAAKKPSTRRVDTMRKVAEEAAELYGEVDLTSGRKTRSGGRRPPPPPPAKKAAGGAKRGRKPKATTSDD